MIVRWSGEAQVNVRYTSNLNLSLTLVDVKLVFPKDKVTLHVRRYRGAENKCVKFNLS